MGSTMTLYILIVAENVQQLGSKHFYQEQFAHDISITDALKSPAFSSHPPN